MYRSLVSHWPSPDAVLPGVREPESQIGTAGGDIRGVEERLMYYDMATYLHDDILTKVDRASMAVSLEVRVPLLDHRIVEFAWRTPLSAKIRAGQGKWLLRQVLNRYVPRHLIDRPKAGFAVPLDRWLRGPLRDWAEHLLSEQRLKQQELFDPARCGRFGPNICRAAAIGAMPSGTCASSRLGSTAGGCRTDVGTEDRA